MDRVFDYSKRWWLPAKIDSKLEKAVFEESDAIEVAWLGIMKDAITKYPELNKDKFHHLPNGFDSNDYPNVNESERTDFRFTITYAGSMYGRRNPAAFLRHWKSCIIEKKLILRKLDLGLLVALVMKFWKCLNLQISEIVLKL